MSVYWIPLVGDAVMFVAVHPPGSYASREEAHVEIATSKGIERAILERHEIAAIVMRLQEVVDRMDRTRLEREETCRTLKGVRDGVPLNQVYAHGDGCRLEDA